MKVFVLVEVPYETMDLYDLVDSIETQVKGAFTTLDKAVSWAKEDYLKFSAPNEISFSINENDDLEESWFIDVKLPNRNPECRYAIRCMSME